MIRRIVIKNFKSLTNVEVNLGAFTVLIGRNGAGKSAFLQALSVLSWLVRYKSINETFEREKVSFNDLVSLKAHCRQVYWACDVEVATGGEAPVMMNYNAAIGKRHYVHVDTEFARPSTSENVPKALEAGMPALGRISRHLAVAAEGAETLEYKGAVIAHSLLQEVGEQTLFGNAKFPVLGALARELAGFRHYQIWGPETLRNESSGKETALSEKGQNLPSVIADLKARRSELGSYDQLLTEMRSAYSWLDDIEVRHFPAGEVGLIFLEKPEAGSKRRLKYLPNQVSDGFLRLLALTALRYQRGKVSILGYEEPENGLHPQLLEQSVSQLRKIAEAGTQVIVTTHSPYLLDYLMDAPEGKLKADLKVVVRGKDGATKILPVSEKKIAEARAQGIRAGELWSLLVDERELT
jgi:predicted ATPase